MALSLALNFSNGRVYGGQAIPKICAILSCYLVPHIYSGEVCFACMEFWQEELNYALAHGLGSMMM